MRRGNDTGDRNALGPLTQAERLAALSRQGIFLRAIFIPGLWRSLWHVSENSPWRPTPGELPFAGPGL